MGSEMKPAREVAEHIETLNFLSRQYLPGGPRDIKGAIRAAIAALKATSAPPGDDEVERLQGHISEQITFAETRIKDGTEMGAAVWRIALEDIIRENRAAITAIPSRDDWRDIASAPKDGTILELVVDYEGGGHPLADARRACTIGFNQFDDTGEDRWQFAGWCWSHDHFTEGSGSPIAWRPSRLNACDDSLPPLPSPQGDAK